MGFLQAAFIRRNTPELRKKLEELGYKRYGNPFQITDDSKLITTIDGEYVPYNVSLDDSFLDCGTNENLFLAIAALRDDTDKFQWFTNGSDYWFVCGDEMCDENVKYYLDKYNMQFHKATVEELIEHFRGKEK